MDALIQLEILNVTMDSHARMMPVLQKMRMRTKKDALAHQMTAYAMILSVVQITSVPQQTKMPMTQDVYSNLLMIVAMMASHVPLIAAEQKIASTEITTLHVMMVLLAQKISVIQAVRMQTKMDAL